MKTLIACGLLLFAGNSLANEPPTLDELFGAGTPGAGGVARGQDLFRIDIPTDQYPEALCADGSPGAFFVRAATQKAHQDDWVIYLQGGGSCNSGENCHERWLGRDGNFGANKLSSTFAPARGMNGGGIENPDPRNPFAGWNHVFGYYCSSDGWAGQAMNKVLRTTAGETEVVYRIHLLGARILDAIIDLMRAENGTVVYRDSENQSIPMPDLDHARHVLLSGSSAGGAGIRSNADRIGALLHEHNVNCDDTSCGLTYAAVIDASFGLGPEQLDHTDSWVCGEDRVGECTYELGMRDRWAISEDFRQGVYDSSCVDYHLPLGDEWRCADGIHLVQHHLASPFFVRVDLQDKLIMGNTLDAGYTFQGVPLDRSLYGELEALQLLNLANIDITSEEPRQPSRLEPPGVFGPQCGDHETLRSDLPTFKRGIIEQGERLTMLQVLSNWLRDEGPKILVETFDPSGPSRSCF